MIPSIFPNSCHVFAGAYSDFSKTLIIDIVISHFKKLVWFTLLPSHSLCVGLLHFFTYQMYGVNPNVGVERKLQPKRPRPQRHTHTHSQGLKSRALSLSLTSCVTLNKVLSLALIQFPHPQNQGMNRMHAMELF